MRSWWLQVDAKDKFGMTALDVVKAEFPAGSRQSDTLIALLSGGKAAEPPLVPATAAEGVVADGPAALVA